MFDLVAELVGIIIASSNKRDDGTKKAMIRSALNMHFGAPSPLSKMCFEYQGVIFNGEKVLRISQMLTVSPPHPLTASLTVKYPFLY